MTFRLCSRSSDFEDKFEGVFASHLDFAVEAVILRANMRDFASRKGSDTVRSLSVSQQETEN